MRFPHHSVQSDSSAGSLSPLKKNGSNILRKLSHLFHIKDTERQGSAPSNGGTQGPCDAAPQSVPAQGAQGTVPGGSHNPVPTPAHQRLRNHLATTSDNNLYKRVHPASITNNLVNSLSVDFEATNQVQHSQQQASASATCTRAASGFSSGSSSYVLTTQASGGFATGQTSAGSDESRSQPHAQGDGGDRTPPPVPAPASVLLAISGATPSSMRRAAWSLRDYDIQKRIYKGATSAVYQAVCNYSGLPVALKVYFLTRVPSNAMHMVAREVTIHSDVVHKHVIALYGAFQEENRLVLVQEWAGRGDLFGVHRALRRRMTEEQAQDAVLLPFLDALAHLHARGICHRDIKPENILFTSDWKLKLADFGVSIDLNSERAVTRAGTLDYMAPEVERCPMKMLPQDNKDDPRLAYDTAVDIWATGVLTYELLVGFPPFVADSHQQQQQQQAAAGARLRFPASLSAAARDFIGAALAEAAAERPTAAQLLQHPWLRAAAQRRKLSAAPSSAPVVVPVAVAAAAVAATPVAVSAFASAAAIAPVSPSPGAVASPIPSTPNNSGPVATGTVPAVLSARSASRQLSRLSGSSRNLGVPASSTPTQVQRQQSLQQQQQLQLQELVSSAPPAVAAGPVA